MNPPETTPSLPALASGFFRIGVSGFGGVGPVARHVIVVERGWLDDVGFARLVGLCQVLPGANTANVAVMLGDRHHGPLGAVTCVVALLAAPLAMLTGLLTLYAHYAAMPFVQLLLAGAAASAAGLVSGTAAKLLLRLKPRAHQALIALAAFVAVALLGMPVTTTLVTVGPAGLLLTLLARRRAR